QELEALDELGRFGPRADVAQEALGFLRLQEAQEMPAREVRVEPERHVRHAVEHAIARALPKVGRDHALEDSLIEGVPGEADAVGADDALASAAAPARSDLDEAEIGGAAAEVSDQDQLVVVEAALVAPRGRHGLELEHDLLEARRQERGAQ